VKNQLDAAFGRDAFEIGSTMDRVSTFFAMLEDEVPELVVHVRKLLEEFNAHIVGNMLHRPADGNALFTMQRLIKDRLGISVDVAASLRHNAQMRATVNSGRPFAVQTTINDQDMFELSQLATRVLRQDLSPMRKIREDFMRALSQRPIDPDLDHRFAFGLEGVAAAAPRVVREPRRSGNTPQQFKSEFSQLHRVSPRLPGQFPIEVNFDGHWYMCNLTETNEGGGLVTGVRAPASWRAARGTLRAIDCGCDEVIACAIHSIDEASGKLIVRFEDGAAATRMIAAMRGR